MQPIRSALPWILLATFFIPLVAINGLFYPFVAPKTFLLQGLGLVAVALFVYLALSGAQFFYGRLRAWYAWIPAALLLVEYVTSLLGIGFFQSFWGLMARGDGLLTSTIIIALFYIVVLVADEAFVRKMFGAIAIAGSLQALVGFLQWVGYQANFVLPLIPPGGDRVGGLFGNAEYLASYLALAGIATLIFAAKSSRPRLWQILAAFEFLVAILTATRGVILALGVAGVIALGFLAFKKGKIALYARSALGVIVVVAALGILLRGPLSHSAFEPLARFESISLSDPTTASRLFVWQGVFSQAITHPLTGVGAEHITQLFDKIYDPTKITEEWFDRSHNSFLDYFAEYGIVGFALYLVLVGSLIWVAYRKWCEKNDPRFALLALAGAVYAVQNFFAFDISSTLWLLFAFFAALLALASDTPAEAPPLPSAFKYLGALLGLLILFALYPVIYEPLEANLNLVTGYLYHVSDINTSITELTAGQNRGTYANMEYGYELEDMYINEQYPDLSGAARVAAYAFAASSLLNDFNAYPYDARTALDLAQVLDQPPPEETPNLQLEALAAGNARLLSPLRSEAWYLLVNVDIEAASEATTSADKLAYYNDAIGAIKQYSILVPSLDEPKLVLAELYLTIGDAQGAEQIVAGLEQSDPALLQTAPDFMNAIESYERTN